MGLLCACPEDASPAAIDNVSCPESVGQIQKALFQRLNSAPGTKNEIVIATNNPNVLATWTPLLAAADATKVVPTPYINAPSVEAGAAREFGGGNETRGGIPLIIGREPTTVTTALYRVPQSVIAQIKKYQCEEAVGVYLLDEFGRIVGLTDDPASPTTFAPIPLAGLFVGDKVLGGLETIDMNSLIWRFFPNWSDNLHIVAPTDFNGLTDLVSP